MQVKIISLINHFFLPALGSWNLSWLHNYSSLYRYEAALILKNACLKHLSLGDVLQILNMVINVQKWISVPQLGWRPVTVTLAENSNYTRKETGA